MAYDNFVLTHEEALELYHEIWTWLAATPHGRVEEWPGWDILKEQYNFTIKDCVNIYFCCQDAQNQRKEESNYCKHCFMRDFWKSFFMCQGCSYNTNNTCGFKHHIHCACKYSPWQIWKDNLNRPNNEAEQAAKLILDAATRLLLLNKGIKT